MATSNDGSTRKRLALALLCVAQFVDVLGLNAATVALPVIGRELGFDPGNLQWVVTAYVLVFGSFLLLAGRLADIYGRRRMFVVGLAIFTASSILCGLAMSPLALVAARAAQGLGAAIVAPAALSIIANMYAEGRDRTFAMGVWTAVAAGGGAAGLVLGGVITDAFGWRWMFFINVPIGVASIALAFILLGADGSPQTKRRPDLLGATTGTAGLALLVYGLTQAEAEGFVSPLTLGVIAMALALIVSFVLVQRTVADPLVPLRIFRVRNLSGAALVAFTNTGTTGPVALLAVFYVQEVLSYSPTVSGMLGLPLSLSVVAGSYLGSRLTVKLGARRTMALGLLGICGGTLLVTRISVDSGVAFVVSNAVISGLALGCSAVASTTCGTSAVPQEERGLASGVLNSAAQIGTALGLAILFAVAVARADVVTGGGEPGAEALVAGYRWAFFVGAGLAALGAVAALRLVRHEAGIKARD